MALVPDVPEKVAEWLKLFAAQNADPLMMLGMKPGGTPVKTIEGEPFDLRQLLADVLCGFDPR